jgi:hypothetical protein
VAVVPKLDYRPTGQDGMGREAEFGFHGAVSCPFPS